MKRKLLSILLVLIMVLTLIPNMGISVFAADEVVSGDLNGGDIHWAIDSEGTLSITKTGGDGVMPDYNGAGAPWYPYQGKINSLIVGEGISHLGAYDFYGCKNLKDIYLPESLISIGDGCFSSCRSLETVNIPNNVEYLGDYAFSECYSLKSFSFPLNTKTVNKGIFRSCYDLEEIKFPEGVKAIESEYLFYYCSSLKNICLPSTLERIGGTEMFVDVNIENIEFGGSLSQWMNVSFSDMDNAFLMSNPCNLYINEELQRNITIPSGFERIPDYVFKNIKSSSVTIPDSVSEIGKGSFSGNSMSVIRMADTVTKVGVNAFENCNIDKLYFVGESDKWEEIEWSAGNNSIKNIEPIFVSSFDKIHSVSVGKNDHGKIAISDDCCIEGDEITVSAKADRGYKLKSIIVNGEPIEGNKFIAEADTDYVVTAEFEMFSDEIIECGTCGDDIDWYLFDTGELYLTGMGDMYDYDIHSINSSPWNKYAETINTITVSEGITGIGRSAFCYLINLKRVSLPNSIKICKNSFFEACPEIETLEYEGSISDWCNITHMGYYPSADSFIIDGEVLENLVIPEGVTSVPDYAFSRCKSLKTVELPSTVRSIGEYAFYECLNMDSVSLNDGLEIIGICAFGLCESLNSMVIPASVDSICNECFYESHLDYLEFEGDVPQEIGNNLFGYTDYGDRGTVIYYHSEKSGWTSPTWNGYYTACVDEPNNYDVLDENNRNSQNILFILNEKSGTASVGNGEKYNASGYYGAQRGKVVIPDKVKKDGVSYDVIGIGSGAFSGNKLVTGVEIGYNVTSIMPDAFFGCPNIESFTVDKESEYYKSVDGVLYDKSELYLYLYPGGKTDKKFSVPDTVKTIGRYAFCDNSHLNEIFVGSNVTSIYSGAFSGVENLKKITLPFVGEKKGSNSRFSVVFGYGDYCSDSLQTEWYGDEAADKGLSEVVILDNYLSPYAFESCISLKTISLSSIPEEIPYGCFAGCVNLERLVSSGVDSEPGKLVLPEGVKQIGENAFSYCKKLVSVTIPSSLEYLYSSAFMDSGIESFKVNEGNQNYSTDTNGVLYNKDKSVLVCYPSCRPWPYYNVLDGTESIERGAFCGCEKLFNIYIPNSVYKIGYMKNCKNMTICCYLNSFASDYALSSNTPVWYMDNKVLQGISVYSLPEESIQKEGEMNLQGLYIVGNYGGKQLQIDSYNLDYDKTSSGIKTVTVEYGGKTATFEIFLVASDDGEVISFDCDKDMDGKTVFIALYDKDGAMLMTDTAFVSNGKAKVFSKESIYDKTDRIKMFVVDSSTFAPAGNAEEMSK